MNKKLETIFNAAKGITPNATFMARSKEQILEREQIPAAPKAARVLFFTGTTARLAVGFAAMVLIATAGITSYVGSNTRSLARSFNDATLEDEAQELDFQIHIKEAAYYDESAKQVSMALDEIAK